MELGGTEKRIQALFSELALADRTRVPRFEKFWTEKTSGAPLFRRSWAVTAAAAVIVAASSFALWPRQPQIAPVAIPTPTAPQLATIIASPRSQPPRQKRIVRHRQTDRVFNEAALLSRWQSPTQNFMQSPSSVSFDSLPQLNQSAKDLESFLPKKESNK